MFTLLQIKYTYIKTGFSSGMTYYLQEELLKLFKEGRHQVVFSTSIGEEGLDVKICNLVVRYEYSTNEIAMMQARGRYTGLSAT